MRAGKHLTREDTESTELVGGGAVEAEGGVALSEEAITRERSMVFLEGAAFLVLGDDEGVRCEQGLAIAAEQAESEGVLLVGGIGRVEEDEVGLAAGFDEAGERGSNAARLEGVSAADGERGEIRSDGAQG